MSIRFVCTCGKHLRAREDMAARRTVCPACGRPVGIPSVQPTQRGTEADPLSLTEHQPLVPPAGDFLRYHVVPLSESSPPVEPSNAFTYRVVPVGEEHLPSDSSRRREAPFDSPGTRVPDISLSAMHLPAEMEARRRERKRERRRREKWDLEKNWLECLAFPLRARALLAWLAIATTLLLGAAAFEIPRLLELEPGERAVWFVWLVLPLLVLGYLCGFWHCVLCSAVTGEAGFVRWPGKDVRIAAEGLVRFIGCFLAGPAFLAAAGFYLWLEGGDLEWIDRVLLAELILVASGYWLFALLAVSEGDSLTYATPVQVLRVFRRLGYRAVIGTLLFALVVALHGAWAISTLTTLHESRFSGWFGVWFCTLSGLFWTTFLFRWLGVRSFLARVAAAAPQPAGDPLVPSAARGIV